jgi:hypothetical protein
LAGRAGSHHWHLGFPDRTGTLELNEWQKRVWVRCIRAVTEAGQLPLLTS